MVRFSQVPCSKLSTLTGPLLMAGCDSGLPLLTRRLSALLVRALSASALQPAEPLRKLQRGVVAGVDS